MKEKRNQPDRAKAIDLRIAGMGVAEIARTLGYEKQKVKYWLRRYKEYGEASLTYYGRCIRHDPANRDAALSEALQECGQSPATIAFIARKYGIAYHNLYYAVRKDPKTAKRRKALLERKTR